MVLNFESKNALIWCIYNLKQLVSTVNPLLSHPRDFLIPNTFGGGGGGLMATGDLFNTLFSRMVICPSILVFE